MKKLLHISAHMGGGVGKAISGILKGLGEYDNTLLLLESTKDQKYINMCNEINIIISKDIKRIKEEAQKADAVILNWWCHPLFAEVFKALNNENLKLLLWSHINGLYYPYLPFEFVDMFDRLMFTSPCVFENKYWTLEENNIIRDKLEIVYGMGEFDPCLSKHKINYQINDKFKIAYSGTLNFSKVHGRFPEICRGIKEILPTAEFHMFGRYDKEFSELFDSEYVKFHGFTDDLEEILPEMDAFCYPLNPENYATTENALLEAMAAALPVIVLNNPAERNIVTNGKDGVIVDNVSNVAESVKQIYQDIDFRKLIGNNARQTVIERYNFKKNCGNFKKSVEYIISASPKKYHFSALELTKPYGYFRFFCGNDWEKVNSYLKGNKNVTLPEIFFGEGKSSFKQFNRYYNLFK